MNTTFSEVYRFTPFDEPEFASPNDMTGNTEICALCGHTWEEHGVGNEECVVTDRTPVVKDFTNPK